MVSDMRATAPAVPHRLRLTLARLNCEMLASSTAEVAFLHNTCPIAEK